MHRGWQTALMRSRLALFVAALAAGTVGVSCGGDAKTAGPTAGTSTPITTGAATVVDSTVAETTTVATTQPVTTIAATTVPASTSTSTTVPPAAKLLLGGDHLGDALFGGEPENVIAYVSALVGAPTADSGWADPNGPFGVCPGTEVRGVVWGDLTLLFSDESNVATGRRHFFSYSYGPAFGAEIQPAGMRTDTGLMVGATVAQLKASYPSAVIYGDDPISGPAFAVNDTFTGLLSGVADTDRVLSFYGGVACGE